VHTATASAADPFDAGPYARLQAALGRGHLWVARAGPCALAVAAICRFRTSRPLRYSIAANVRAMRLTPFDLWAVLPLLAAALLPFLPLVFTVVSPKDILQFAAKLVL
jgi:hypothetical protein